MTRLYGIAPLTHLALHPLEMPRNARQAGYDFMGLRLVPATPGEPAYDTQGVTSLVRELARRLQGEGMAVLDIEILRLQARTVVADFQPVLEAGAFLGARHVLAAPQDADTPRLCERLAQLGERAAALGMTVQLEPTPWYEVSTLQASAALIARSGCPGAGIVVDALHFDRAGQRLDDVLALTAGLFRYLQLCDAPRQRPSTLAEMLRQAREDRLMPGDGGLDLAGLLAAMPAHLPISLEVPMVDAPSGEALALRSRRMLEKARALVEASAP